MNGKLWIVNYNIADGLTLGGVSAAVMAAAAILSGEMHLALALLYLAIFFDGIDGPVARKMNLLRPFGRFLDGFADVLTYVVLPLLLLRHLDVLRGVFGAFAALLFVCAAISRLAVFNEIGNVNEDDRMTYLGMPVFWAGLACGPVYGLQSVWHGVGFRVCMGALLGVYSLAMIANRRFWKPKSMLLIAAFTLCGFFVFGALALKQFIQN